MLSKILLLSFILLAIFLRFYDLNWDQNYSLHPDEENIANAARRIQFFSQLNPKFFAYGGIYIYLEKGVSDILSTTLGPDFKPNGIFSYIVIGRFFSALFSSLSAIVIFLLAKELYNKKVALITLFLYTLNTASIQAAHFAVTESLLILLLITIVLISIKLYKNPIIFNYILAGLVYGLSLATKTSALLFITPVVAVHLLFLIKQPKLFLTLNIRLIIFFIASICVFMILSPYSVLDWPNFYKSMQFESSVVTGAKKVTYTLQFAYSLPYIFQIKNLFWQMGPIVILSMIGFIKLLFDCRHQRDFKLLLFLSFPLIYFLVIGPWYAKFIRYQLPLIPFLVVSASILLYQIQNRFFKIGLILSLVSFIVTLLWSFSFLNIYTREDSRISASNWIYQNIPKGNSIMIEYHDSTLPLKIEPFKPDVYNLISIDSFNSNDYNYYAEKLTSADYIVLSSRRIYKTIENLSQKYPLANQYYVPNKYYRLLFTNQLGYQKVSEFNSYPSLLGFIINDDSSEETFQVFDHPNIQVFKNLQQLGKNDYAELLKNPMY